MRVPVAVGVKVTLMMHDFPGATLDRHVFVSAKSPAFAPVMLIMPMMANVVLPMLVSFTFFGLLVVPTDWLPKLTDLGVSTTALVAILDMKPSYPPLLLL